MDLSPPAESAPLIASSKDAILFLLDCGDGEAGEGSCSSLVRCTGLEVDVERVSWALLLLRGLREGFSASIGEREALSPTCMVDLTYLLGILKNVATGGEGGRRIGGSTRLANILDESDGY